MRRKKDEVFRPHLIHWVWIIRSTSGCVLRSGVVCPVVTLTQVNTFLGTNFGPRILVDVQELGYSRLVSALGNFKLWAWGPQWKVKAFSPQWFCLVDQWGGTFTTYGEAWSGHPLF